MTKAALWLRVSTEEQTTANQLPDLERVCSARDWEIVKRYDVTASAFKGDHQVMLTTMVADASHGDFDVLAVWALDRLTRQGGEETIRVLGQLADRGVTVASFREPWVEDAFKTLDQRTLVAMLREMAKEESSRRSAQTKIGMQRARLEGKHIGRPKGAKDKQPRRRAERLAVR